ncbi:MAG: sigma-70 family RNA polymerase sigma factor [Planctomycetota bacterium]
MKTELSRSEPVEERDAVVESPARAGVESRRSPEEIEAERELIRAVQAGDHAAFETLVKTYEQKVFWVAYNFLGNTEDARDVAQDSFMRVFKAIDRFDLRFNFYTWLYRIVVNLSIDRIRKKSKRATVSIEDFPTDPADERTPEDAFRETEKGRKILEVLDELPTKYRTMIVLRDIEELSCEEIAVIIGCTNATTRWRLHRARELFKERWERIEI